MEDQIERWQCPRCQVSYRVGKKRDKRCDAFRCSSPGCGLKFWAGERMEGHKSVVTMNMEVRPE